VPVLDPRRHGVLAPGTPAPDARRFRLATLLGALLLSLLVAACQQLPPIPGLAAATPTPTLRPSERPTPTPLPAIVDSGPVVEPKSQVYVTGVSFPVGLAFAPDGRLFFNEAKSGVLRIAEPMNGVGRLMTQPFVQIETAKGAETGMLGVALDPEFEQNRWVYVYYTEPDANRKDRVPLRNRIVRFTERDNIGTDMTVILDDIAVSRQGVHNGGILRFGPDGKLYVTVGNAQSGRAEGNVSQDPKSINGKILRLNKDGTVPSDNPTPGSPVYAMGFRNPFGMAFEPTTNRVWVTENSGDNNDEINALEPGGNYGFPIYEGFGNDARYNDPVWSSGSRTIGPTGLVFYTGDQLPQFKGDLFFCAMNTGALTRLRFSGADRQTVHGGEAVTKDCFLDVINGPDGALYYSSVNQILKLGR
jgi:glucose/arabinose dehydrogenase